MKFKQLECGLKIYHQQFDSPITSFQIYTPFGGDDLKYIDGDKQVTIQPGSAHYFEHVLFIMPPLGKDGKMIKYRTNTPKTKKNLRNGITELKKNKTIIVNAYTSNDHTNYWFVGRRNNKQNLDTMLDYVLRPYLPQDRFKKEVGTILDEAKRRLNNSNSEHWQKIFENLFFEHGAKFPIIGTLESIPKISLEDVLSVHGVFYRPSNISLIVTGPADTEEIICSAENKIEELGLQKYIPAPELVDVNEPLTSRKKDNFNSPILRDDVLKSDIAAASKLMRDKENALDDMVSISMISTALFGPGSKNRNHMLENGMDHNTFYGFSTHKKDYSLLIVESFFEDPETFRNKITENFCSFFNGIPESEIEFARNSMILNQETENSNMMDHAKQLAYTSVLLGSPEKYTNYLDRINTITPDEINSRVRHVLDPEKMTFVQMLPKPKK